MGCNKKIKPLEINDICGLECVENKSQFHKTFQEIIEKKTNKIVLREFSFRNKKGQQKKFTLQYAPVGNYTENPLVIICGKTTSGDSHDMFIDSLQSGKELHEACFCSTFSNMKDNLFKYLNQIRLFNYLGKKTHYWEKGEYKELWDDIFTNLKSSISSGIQLTQACNCAILNEEQSKRSNEPDRKVFEQFYNETKCFFKQFRISTNLKLIVFLDTPSNDGRFHQINYWNRYFKHSYPCVKVISITHPSSQNSDVYNNLEDLTKMKNEKKKPNAIKLFNEAIKTVQCLD